MGTSSSSTPTHELGLNRLISAFCHRWILFSLSASAMSFSLLVQGQRNRSSIGLISSSNMNQPPILQLIIRLAVRQLVLLVVQGGILFESLLAGFRSTS